MDDKKTSFLFKIVRWLVRLFAPKFKVVGAENLPNEACVIVGNHSQMYGPIASELYTPIKHDIWCTGEMMCKDEVAAYAFKDFWSMKPKSVQWFYKILSHLIVPLSLLIFNNAHTIPVFHDSRLRTTFRLSMERLDAGSSLVIFPECYTERNNIVHEFQEKFVDLARMYYKKTGVELRFVPMYLAPRLATIFYGKPIRFNAGAPIAEERVRVCNELMDAITEIAVTQPEHTVVPYPNISKKLYPKNVPLEVFCHEESLG